MPATSQAISFVHAGMAKCMSTSLQTMWGASSNYNYCSATSLKTSVEKNIETEYARHGMVPEILDPGRVNFNNSTPDLPSVLSCEGLTYSWSHNPEMAGCIDLKQQLLSKMLSGSSNKLLLIVRNPIDWIYSAFAQQVREGGLLDLVDYQKTFGLFFEQNLNLKQILDTWKQAGFDPIIIPMECYRADPSLFWEIYEAKLNIQRPEKFNVDLDDSRRNSTRYEVLQDHLNLNRIFDLLAQATQSDKNDIRDKKQVLEALNYARKWGVRRGLTFADDLHLSELRNIINPGKSQVRKENISINDSFKEHLIENFVGPLMKTVDASCLDILRQYESSIITQHRFHS